MEKNELLEDNSIVAMLMHMAKEMKHSMIPYIAATNFIFTSSFW